jgi:hypothetical protein
MNTESECMEAERALEKLPRAICISFGIDSVGMLPDGPFTFVVAIINAGHFKCGSTHRSL